MLSRRVGIAEPLPKLNPTDFKVVRLDQREVTTSWEKFNAIRAIDVLFEAGDELL